MLITLVGAAKTAISVRLTPYEAGQTAASRIMSDDEHEWQNMPLAQSLIKASPWSHVGLDFHRFGNTIPDNISVDDHIEEKTWLADL